MSTRELISAAIGLGTKTAKYNLKKMTIDTIYYVPTVYKNLKNKVKNKIVKSVLDTGVGDYIVNRGVGLIGEPFN